MQFDQRYRKDPHIISREIAGEVILVPISQEVGEIRGSIFTLNETAARAWSLIDDAHNLADIRAAIVAEYVVDDAQAGQDLLDLVAQLEEIGAIHPMIVSQDQGE